VQALGEGVRAEELLEQRLLAQVSHLNPAQRRQLLVQYAEFGWIP
jgi:hypothetical protein